MDSAAVGPIATWGPEVLFIAAVSGVLLFLYLVLWLIVDASRLDHRWGDVAESTTPAAAESERES